MAKNFKPVFVLNAAIGAVSFANADSTNAKVIIAAQATEGTRVEKLLATSDDTSPRIMALELFDGSTAYVIGTITVGALSGTDGSAASVNLLNSVQSPWAATDGSISLKPGWSLRARALVAITAAKKLSIVALGGDFA